MFKADYVIVVITENGFSVEELAELNEQQALVAYTVAKRSIEGAKVALYKKVKSE